MEAILTFAAFWRIERDDVIALLYTFHAWPNINNYAGALVPQNGRKDAFRVSARKREFVCMAYACRLDLNQDFTLRGPARSSSAMSKGLPFSKATAALVFIMQSFALRGFTGLAVHTA